MEDRAYSLACFSSGALLSLQARTTSRAACPTDAGHSGGIKPHRPRERHCSCRTPSWPTSPSPEGGTPTGEKGGDAGVPSANGGRVPGTVTAAPAWGRDTGRAVPASSRRRAPGAARQPRPPGSAALPWCPRRPGSPGGSRRTGRGS